MNSKTGVLMVLIAMLLLAACNPFGSVKSIPLTSGEKTQPAATATLSVLSTSSTQSPAPPPAVAQTQASGPIQTPVPSPTLVPTTLVPTAAVQTQAPTPPLPVTQVPASLPLPGAPACNLAELVADVTIQDGSAVGTGQSFIKTWRLQNAGTCTWDTLYDLVFVSGAQMGAPAALDLPARVIPGAEIDLTVSMVAPDSPGIYQGNWMLRSSDGVLFGLGPDGKQPFWVNIDVTNTIPFAVTDAPASMQNARVSGVCKVTLTFDANITTNGAGTVTYFWRRSDGSSSDPVTLEYSEAGSQQVSDIWTPPAGHTGLSVWDRVYIDQPNHQFFPAAHFSLNCNLPTPTATPKTKK